MRPLVKCLLDPLLLEGPWNNVSGRSCVWHGPPPSRCEPVEGIVEALAEANESRAIARGPGTTRNHGAHKGSP